MLAEPFFYSGDSFCVISSRYRMLSRTEPSCSTLSNLLNSEVISVRCSMTFFWMRMFGRISIFSSNSRFRIKSCLNIPEVLTCISSRYPSSGETRNATALHRQWHFGSLFFTDMTPVVLFYTRYQLTVLRPRNCHTMTHLRHGMAIFLFLPCKKACCKLTFCSRHFPIYYHSTFLAEVG